MHDLLSKREVWQEYLEYKLSGGHLSKEDEKALSDFLEAQRFLPVAERIARGECFAPPKKAEISKLNSGKKRVVYIYEEDENWVLKLLTDPELGVIADVTEIGAVGHRIAHGGEKLRESCLIDDEVIKYLYSIVKINPLHGPPAIAGMEGCRKLMKDVPMVGVFDTSFHSTMPDYAYIYPIPYEMYEQKSIRRYGFHGTSHRYVANRVAELMGKKIEDLKIITCHLGNGSSITAIDGGRWWTPPWASPRRRAS